MTNVEKEMNKDDLIAWKKYDNNQYSMIPGVSNHKKMAEQRPLKTFSPQITGVGNKIHGLNEGKLRVQEDRLAQYGILAKGGSLPNTRHGSIPVDTDSKGRIDLGTIQVNAANLGERKAPLNSSHANIETASPLGNASASRNPYLNSNPLSHSGSGLPSPKNQFATPQQVSGKMINERLWQQSQRDLSMPSDSRLDAFKTVSINSKNGQAAEDLPASLSRSFDARHNSSANPIVR